MQNLKILADGTNSNTQAPCENKYLPKMNIAKKSALCKFSIDNVEIMDRLQVPNARHSFYTLSMPEMAFANH